ncbi:CheR family methyltransferase [Endothiovibrio diazotrophicus]
MAGSEGGAPGREFVFTDRDFARIRELVKQNAGIHLSDAKKNMVYSRLSRRLRELRLTSFDVYLQRLDHQSGEELVNFINAITTNLTAFFRENHHFEFLTTTLLPELMRRKGADRRIRIWSAGCSSGEEPYSIAIAVREALPPGQYWDVRILATDLDSNMVTTAARGVYTLERVSGLSGQRLRRWFRRGTGAREGLVKVAGELREMITFKQLNLMHEWPIRGPIDVIFCRNVVIYFDKETQRRLFDRYADLMPEQGHLFIGHSESLFKVTERFDPLGNTIYRKRI